MRFLSVCLAAILCAGLFGCGESSSAKTPPKTQEDWMKNQTQPQQYYQQQQSDGGDATRPGSDRMKNMPAGYPMPTTGMPESD